MHDAPARVRSVPGAFRKISRAILPVLLLAQVLGATAASAAPAAPNVVKEARQPDGTVLSLRLWGDEFVHGWETLGGYTVVKNAATGAWDFALVGPSGTLVPSGLEVGETDPPAPRHLRPTDAVIDAARAAEGAPPIGTPYLLAPPPWAGPDTALLFIMVEFSDEACTFSVSDMQANMFGNTSTGPGNMEDYYDEISYGDLDIDGTVVGDGGNGCVTLANTKAHYDTGAGSDNSLVNEALAIVDPYVNFDDYDNDGDGWVDALGIIYAGGGPHDGCDTDDGPDGGDGDDLWPHSTGTGGTATDEADVDRYIINSEVTKPATGGACNQIQTIGLFAHEFGHSLGLPDLYDTNGGSEGVGAWSTMGSQYQSTVNLADTPPHFDPWSKWFLGWVTPTDLTGADQLVNLDQVETSGEVLQLLSNPGGVERGGSGQYFLVENRQLVGFDQAGVGCGVVIWHIDETQTGNQNESQKLVDVEEADGDNDLDNEVNRGDQGDAFPGTDNNHLFDDTSNPNSDLYGGASSGVRVRVQNNSCASTMQVAVGPNDAPVAEAGGPYTTDEGDDVNLNGTGTDADGDPLTYDWDPDGVFVDDGVEDPTFNAVGQDGITNVTLTVTDPSNESDDDTAGVTVENVEPTVDSLSGTAPIAAPVDEGETVTVSGSISDPGWLDPLSATIDWGDGNGPQPVSGSVENTRPDATFTFSVDHVYGDNGVYVAEVCGSDDDTTTCDSIDLHIANVDPTAEIDMTGSVDVNGTQTIIAHAGQPVDFSGRSTDPGSDDLLLTWDWDDGAPAPDEMHPYLVNPPFPDPPMSPSVQPRDVTNMTTHTFGQACAYEPTFASRDDDLGSADDSAAVLITGNADRSRSTGWWHPQFKENGTKADFDQTTLECYLEITRFGSDVFDEVRPLSTLEDAHAIFHKDDALSSHQEKLDKVLLAGWLNFANGAFGWLQPVVDTNGDKVPDLNFAIAVANAETVRLNPLSTKDDLEDQRKILDKFNHYKP